MSRQPSKRAATKAAKREDLKSAYYRAEIDAERARKKLTEAEAAVRVADYAAREAVLNLKAARAYLVETDRLRKAAEKAAETAFSTMYRYGDS